MPTSPSGYNTNHALAIIPEVFRSPDIAKIDYLVRPPPSSIFHRLSTSDASEDRLLRRQRFLPRRRLQQAACPAGDLPPEPPSHSFAPADPCAQSPDSPHHHTAGGRAPARRRPSPGRTTRQGPQRRTHESLRKSREECWGRAYRPRTANRRLRPLDCHDGTCWVGWRDATSRQLGSREKRSLH